MRQLSDHLWVEEASQQIHGEDVGTRMTVVRLDDDLWIHSPVPMDEGRRTAVESLGTVRYLVAPNRFHHLYLDGWTDAYPEAELWGAPGLAEKRADLGFDHELTADEPPWTPRLEQMLLEGAPTVSEVLFFHRESRSLIGADLFFNDWRQESALSRVYFWLNAILGKPELARRLEFDDPRRLRRSFEQILEWDFTRIVISHGAIVERNAREILRHIYRRHFA